MHFTLRSNQMFALALLVILTLLVVGLVVFSTIAHINLWHSFTSFDVNPKVIWTGH